MHQGRYGTQLAHVQQQKCQNQTQNNQEKLPATIRLLLARFPPCLAPLRVVGEDAREDRRGAPGAEGGADRGGGAGDPDEDDGDRALPPGVWWARGLVSYTCRLPHSEQPSRPRAPGVSKRFEAGVHSHRLLDRHKGDACGPVALPGGIRGLARRRQPRRACTLCTTSSNAAEGVTSSRT